MLSSFQLSSNLKPSLAWCMLASGLTSCPPKVMTLAGADRLQAPCMLNSVCECETSHIVILPIHL